MKTGKTLILISIFILLFSCTEKKNKSNQVGYIIKQDTLNKNKSSNSIPTQKKLNINGIWVMYKYLPAERNKVNRLDTTILLTINDSLIVKNKGSKYLMNETLIFTDDNIGWTKYDIKKMKGAYIRYNKKYDYLIYFQRGEDGIAEYYKRK